MTDSDPRRTVSRRRLLAMTTLAGDAVAATGGAGVAAATRGESGRSDGDRRIAFDGEHQAGILAPYASHGWFAAFDLEPHADAARLQAMLRAWTEAARRRTAGRPPVGDDAMASGYGPDVTVGFGASLLRRLGAAVPEALAPLPPFPRDEIDPARSDCDIGVLFTSRFIRHTSSALFAVPRGCRSGRYLGQDLMETLR
jgi:dye decolorizing peroxidase